MACQQATEALGIGKADGHAGGGQRVRAAPASPTMAAPGSTERSVQIASLAAICGARDRASEHRLA